MKTKPTAALSAMLAAVMTLSLSVQPVCARAEDSKLDAYIHEVILLVNEERAIYGLTPLQSSPALNQAAQQRAAETVKSFSHTRPDGQGSETVLAELGIAWRTCGENIAYGYTDAEAVMDGWMHSEGHRANILSTSYEYFGVGAVEHGGVVYCVQVFTGGTQPDTAASAPVSLPEETVSVTVPDPAAPCIGEACVEIPCPARSCGTAQTLCTGGTCLPDALPSCGNSLVSLLCKLTGKC